MIDSVRCIAVGHFGDGKAYVENYDKSTMNMWTVKTDKDNGDIPVGLYQQVVEWFSRPSEWVLHTSDSERGKFIMHVL